MPNAEEVIEEVVTPQQIEFRLNPEAKVNPEIGQAQVKRLIMSTFIKCQVERIDPEDKWKAGMLDLKVGRVGVVVVSRDKTNLG